MVEMQRDLLTGAMDIYIECCESTNQVNKVLTVLGTIAIPAIAISSFFGMNQDDLPWSHSPYGTEIAARADGTGDSRVADHAEEV